MAAKNKPLSLLFISLLFISLFVSSFFGSFFIFSSSHLFAMKNLRQKVIDDGEIDLVLITEADYSLETWISIDEINTSDSPFTNCASRYSKQLLDNNETITLFDVPLFDDPNFSFNHIYGYKGVWQEFEIGKIIVSYDFNIAFPSCNYLSFPLDSGDAITFDNIGYSDGRREGVRTRLGDVLADEFGLFALITREDMDKLNVDGFIKTVSTTQNAKAFNLECEKWFSSPGISLKQTSFSSPSLQKIFAFFAFSKEKALFVFLGIVILLLASAITIYSVYFYRKRIIVSGFKFQVASAIMVLIEWVILSFAFSRLFLSIEGRSIKIIDSGGMVFPTAFSLVLYLFIILSVLNKVIKKYYFAKKPINDNIFFTIDI